ncbi:hypothetical protein [Hirschia litorea]|uniref:SH3 domain-containing protein n=1 Tax=Hirschia litorea TaxID=1199156 RepID=A0ABW2ILE5_9PROT
MTFWRQGSNDSLNDKLVRPRSSSSYWDRKPQNAEPANDREQSLKDAQDVFSDVSDNMRESANSALETPKDEITQAVEKIFPDDLKSNENDLPDLPSAEKLSVDEEIQAAEDTIDIPDLPEIPDDSAFDDEFDKALSALPPVPSLENDLPETDLSEIDDSDLEMPSLDTLADAPSEAQTTNSSSLENLSMDQEDEDDMEDEYDFHEEDDKADTFADANAYFNDDVNSEAETDLSTDDLEIPDALPDLPSEDLDESFNLQNAEIKDLETPSLETLELDEPEEVGQELNSASSTSSKMPPILPAGGHTSGNTAHKLDEEEFPENDTDSESDKEVVAETKPDHNSRNEDAREQTASRDGHGSGQVIAFPPHQGKPSQPTEDERTAASSTDGLTEEERLAISLSDGAAAAHTTANATNKDSRFNTRIAKPKSDGPFVTPRRTAATYYDNSEQVYEPGLEDDDGYYVPAQDSSDGSGRRIALYLAGAASISAICGAVYLMLPKGQSDDVQLADTNATTQPSLPSITTTTRDTQTPSTALAETEQTGSSAQDAPLNDTRVFDDLKASDAVENDAAIGTSEADLFASTPEVSTPEAPKTAANSDARSLTQNTTTLATPDLKTPAISKPQVTEKAPELTLSQKPKAAEPKVAEPKAIEPKVTEPAAKAPVKLAPPKATTPPRAQTPPAPKVSAPKLAKGNLFTGKKSNKIVRADNVKSLAPLAVSMGERVYDGVMRAGSMPQTIVDALFSNGAYLASKEQKQFAYNVRHAAKTTRDGEVNSITTQNGTRVDLHFLSTQNEVRPTFVTRASNVEPLPRYMLLQDDWARVSTPTKLYAAPTSYDQTVLKSLPLNTTVERMGSITDSTGEQWSMVGQNGIAIGYVPSQSLISLTGSGTQTIKPFKTSISSSVIERIDVSVPCRDYTMTIGGMGSMHSACMTPDGDWMSKEGANSGLSYAVPPTTSTVSSPLPSITPTSSATPQRTDLSKDAEAILFQPETLRRDARHGHGSASQRIGSIFSQASAVSISTPDGQLGTLTSPQKASTSKSTANTSNVTLKSGLVQVNRQVRLMNEPAGSVVPDADTVMRGDVLEAISVTTTPTGESWTLLGQNGVGYGYVRTDYTSSASGTGQLYDGYQSGTKITSGEVYESPKLDCQSATYAAGVEKGVIKACLQPNGMWTAEVEPSNSYDIRATAHLDHIQGGSSLW